MADDAILKKITPAVQAALDVSETEIATKQAKGLKLYLREPFAQDGNQKGRSEYVSGDATNSVSWMLAQLVKIMDSQTKVVEYLPRGPEDEALATQQTEVVNYIVRESNSYALFLNEWIKSGLITGLGICTADLVTETGWSPASVISATDDQLPAIVAAEEAGELRIVSRGEPQLMPPPSPELPPISVRELTIRHARKGSKIAISTIPVERFFVSADADFDHSTGGISADVQGFWRDLPRYKLKEMGFDKAKVDSIPTAEEDHSEIADMRKRYGSTDTSPSDLHDEVRVYEVFARLDADGDGYTELVRITIGGDPSAEAVILNVSEVSLAPFAAFSYRPLPNSLFGPGLPAVIEQEMRLASQGKRAIIDNLNLSNFPVRVVNPDAVNVDDLLYPHPDKIVRAEDPNAVTYVTPPFVAGQSYPFISMLEEGMEQATGVGRNLMGITGPDMQNETATGASMRNNASQMLVEHTARMFAETGYRYLFRVITSLLIDNADAAAKMTARLTNGYTPITTDGWSAELDLRTNVAFGVTDKAATLNSLSMILAQQQNGIAAGISTPAHVFQTLALMAEAAGYRNAERFFLDPAKQPPQPPAPPAPDPAMVKAQMEMQMAQARLEMEREKMAFDQQLATQKLNAEIELDRQRAQFEMDLRMKELAAESAITAMRNPTNVNVRYPE